MTRMMLTFFFFKHRSTAVCLFFFLFAAAAQAQSNSSNTNSSSSSTDSDSNNNNNNTTDGNGDGNYSWWRPPAEFKLPPWGFSSYGNNGNPNGSLYIQPAGYALDVVRPGWSWSSNRQAHLMAPFCYDDIPGYKSTCYTVQKDECNDAQLSGGMPAYNGLFCLTHQPHVIVGPVCWNRTCFGPETREACATVKNGWFVGGKGSNTATPLDETIESLDVGWCVVPGNDYTVFGPACYGQECFTDELIDACQTLNGTNFADRFCLLDTSAYTIIGPICTPNKGPIEADSNCYPDETAQLCSEMDGISVGGIYCILKGSNYSVLGPFCTSQIYDEEPENIYPWCVTVEEGEAGCQALSGRSLGNGTFCVLDGSDYRLLGPLCANNGCERYDGSKFGGENRCLSQFGGQSFGSYSCVIKGDYTIIGPSNYGNLGLMGDNLLASDVDENMVHEAMNGIGAWTVLNGSFSVYGPTCWGSSCYDGDCVGAGGSKIRSLFCAMKIGGAGSDSSSNGSSSSGATSILLLSHIMAAAIACCLCLFLQY